MKYRVLIPTIGAIVLLLLSLILLFTLMDRHPISTEPVIQGHASTDPTATIAETLTPTESPTVPATVAPTVAPTQAPPVIYSDIPEINDFMNQRLTEWICPLKDPFGEVTGDRMFANSRSGGNRAHAGIDFVAPHGTVVYAITSGTVQRVAVFYQSTYAVEVLNDDGSVLRYCEIATQLKVGDYVHQGDVIGTIQRATGGTEMLHMEVYYGNVSGPLTQTWNRNYLYVDSGKVFIRRSDLLDPTFLKDLPVIP